MGKRATYTCVREDTSIPWYFEVMKTADTSSPEYQAWMARFSYLGECLEAGTVTATFSNTPTQMTSILEVTDDAVWDQVVALTQNTATDVQAYCAENSMTYTVTIEDI